jgi:hypothetical protein
MASIQDFRLSSASCFQEDVGVNGQVGGFEQPLGQAEALTHKPLVRGDAGAGHEPAGERPGLMVARRAKSSTATAQACSPRAAS